MGVGVRHSAQSWARVQGGHRQVLAALLPPTCILWGAQKEEPGRQTAGDLARPTGHGKQSRTRTGGCHCAGLAGRRRGWGADGCWFAWQERGECAIGCRGLAGSERGAIEALHGDGR